MPDTFPAPATRSPWKNTLQLAALSAVLSVGASLAATSRARRVGLTKSEARLSLPGDLLLPVAPFQGDRAHEFTATKDELWPALYEIGDLYSFLWEKDLEIVAEEPGEALVWAQKDTDPRWNGTLTAALLPGVDGTTVLHLRERYQPGEKYRRGTAEWLLAKSALLAPSTWARIRRFLRS